MQSAFSASCSRRFADDIEGRTGGRDIGDTDGIAIHCRDGGRRTRHLRNDIARQSQAKRVGEGDVFHGGGRCVFGEEAQGLVDACQVVQGSPFR